MLAQMRLFLTADVAAAILVAESDPRAASLYAAVGDEIPDSAAERFGLVDGKLPDVPNVKLPSTPAPVKAKPSGRTPSAGKKSAASKSKPAPRTKEAPTPANKEKDADQDKGSDGAGGSGAEDGGGTGGGQ